MLVVTLLLAMAACIRATPVASPVADADTADTADAAKPATTSWTSLDIDEDTVNWTNISKADFRNPNNWKTLDNIDKEYTHNDTDTLDRRSGPCQQGNCPDYGKGFDLVYTFTAVPVPGDPPLTIFEARSDIRVNDCNKCYRHKVGSNLGLTVPGGCYDFTACGRKQSICVDPGKHRAHRIWKDVGHKTCYKMKVENLGDCGFIKSRIVIHPAGTTACTW